MGIDYLCGCRCSFGHWFLCNKHENLIILEEVKTQLEQEKQIDK